MKSASPSKWLDTQKLNFFVVFPSLIVLFEIGSILNILKWLVTQKSNFVVGFPPSVQDFFCYITLTFKRTSYLDLKFHNLSPFWLEIPQNLSKIFKKGTNCEILYLINRRLGRLKVHVIKQKSLVLMGETLQQN